MHHHSIEYTNLKCDRLHAMYALKYKHAIDTYKL